MLTEKQVKNAKPGAKVRKLYDSNGLLLRIAPNGRKSWEFKYRVQGPDGALIEKCLSLGAYDEVSLRQARDKCNEARKLRQEGKDPVQQRQIAKLQVKTDLANTFQVVAEEWHRLNKGKWCDDHADRTWRRVELHLLPRLGKLPVASISVVELLDLLRKIEAEEKTETTHRLLQICRNIFQFAIITRRATYNPAYDLQGALKAHKEQNLPTIEAGELPKFFSRLEGSNVSALTQLAIKFLMLTMVRQGELRQALWTDINPDASEWRIRSETTKMRQLHIVPLSSQAKAILLLLRKISGEMPYLFPSQGGWKHPIMSENTINKGIHDVGYKGQLVGHGFRALASTILNEEGFMPDVIERQLAHMPRDKVRAAYNRAQYLPERRKMMQWWGDYLEKAGLKMETFDKALRKPLKLPE